MTDLRLRDINSWVLDALKSQARLHGTTMERYAKDKLTEALLEPRRELAIRLKEQLDTELETNGLHEDSAVGIRQERDARG